MTWRDAAVLAMKNLRRRFGRSLLTVLAVALAATLLTALVTIAGTARTRVLQELAKGGPLAGIRVEAAEPDPAQIDNDNARPGPPRDLDEEAKARITALPDVSSVVPVVSSQVLVVTPDPPVDAEILNGLPTSDDTRTPTPAGAADPLTPPEPFGDNLVGVDLSQIDKLPISVLAGRLPAAGSTEVVVTQGYLERIGLAKTQAAAVVGTDLMIGAPRMTETSDGPRFRGRWTKRTVVGVVTQEAARGQIVGSVDEARLAREWTAAGGDDGGRLRIPTSPYTGLFVVAAGLDKVSAVRAEITDIGYSTTAPENLIASVQRYLRVVEIVLGAIGLIALVIASIGITNALLSAVRERRREIGVLKAIGARDRDVLRVFLLDAAVLGFVGGLIGTAGGYAVAAGVSQVVNTYLAGEGLAGVQLGVPVLILVGSVTGSTLLALGAGALPALAAAGLAALALAGCAAPRATTVPGAAAPSGPPLTYAAVGASETVGIGADERLREAWPRVFFLSALPEQAVFVNLGIPGATVADALRQELPMVDEVKPQLVTVWLNVNDIAAGVSPAQYERDLGTLVRALRRGGATRVLVANVPPLDQLPAYLACRTAGEGCELADRLPGPDALNRVVDAYNAAIDRVVTREGAALVDLHAVGVSARQSGTAANLVSGDGFHPSTAGHAAVAQAFAEAFRASGPLTPSG